MGQTLKRSQTLALFKTKLILQNSYALTYLALPLFMVIGMPILYRFQLEMNDLPVELMALVATMGTILNIGSVAITIPAMLMAEEKEKHTLRSLMVSSVTSTEYLLGSLVPSFILSLAIQALYLPILVDKIDPLKAGIYLAVCALAILSANLLGMCLGLFAKDQMTASLIPMPLTIVIGAIPMMADKVDIVGKINQYFFVSIADGTLTGMIMGKNVTVSPLQFVSLVVTLVVCGGLFYWLYKRNGFEKD